MLKRVTSLGLAAMLIVGLGGCSNMTRQEQRALSGGALGSAAGLGIAAITGGSLLVGGLVGAAGGAAIGAVTK
jgi:osmotically inducible lipoprotein OsmB